MAQYIDKSAVETELQRRLKSYKEEIEKYSPFQHNFVIDIIGKKQECNDILSFLNTFEVKDVDFHKELLSFYRHTNDGGSEIALAKHFFELGLTQVIDLNIPCTLIVYENKLYEANWIPRSCKDKCENCPINSQCTSEDMSLCEQYGLNPKDMHIVKELI